MQSQNILKFFSKANIYVGVFLILFSPAYLYVSAQLQPVTYTSNSLPANQVQRENNILQGGLGAISNNKFAINKLKALEFLDDGRIKIPSIGVDTKFYEGSDVSILDKGIWRMPMHATPDQINSNDPVVLAGHRWGEDNLSYSYRSKNLFLNLPNLNKGDVIELTWNGGIYKYVVDEVQKNNYVNRLADLILITCVDYVSTVRYFVFATRI